MESFAGFWQYLRFIFLRERITSSVWVISLAGSAILFAAIYPNLFNSEEEMLGLAQNMDIPSMVAMMGPIFGLDELTVAMVMTQQCLIWFMLAIAVMNILLVNRLTRTEEEQGRLELFRALPVGRLTNASATLFFACLVNFVVALLCMVGLVAINIDGTSLAGAFTYSFSMGAVGFFFAALTLLMAQLFSTARATAGAAFALLGAFYLIRAMGDMQQSWVTFLSPFGIGLRVFSFYENNTWPLVVLISASVVIAAVAAAVNMRRDLGEGIIPARPGRRHASRFLRSSLGLAWRLNRNAVIGWGLTAVIIGSMYGPILGELEEFVATNDVIRQMLEAAGQGDTLVDSFVAMLSSVMAIIAAVPVVMAALKIHAEEKRGRMEQVYATATSRVGMYLGFLSVAFVQSLLFMVMSALGLYVSGESTGLLDLGQLMIASLVYLPALWVLAGMAVFFVGILPKAIPLIWGLLAYSFVTVYFGRMFELPEWTDLITPFGSVPQIPVEDFSLLPLVMLTAVAVALTGAGLATYSQRDLR